jgi:branched-chain amino acid transport system permease protein
MTEFLQFLFSGVTVGSIYALTALGFIIIYNASGVVNFAQGEFVMIGGMTTAFAVSLGMPLWAAALVAVVVTVIVGLLLQVLAIRPARDASVVSLIIITIGASIFLKGVAQIVFGKQIHSFPPFVSRTPIEVAGATILPQSIVVIVVSLAIFVGLFLFFRGTLTGLGVLATSNNRLASKLVGINTEFVTLLAFGLSAAAGAIAGIVITPISLTSAEVGVMLAVKGFAAAMLGGMGSPIGAILGGLALGLVEAMTAGFISSTYKDAVPFLLILLVLVIRPQGLIGSRSVERV